MSHPVILLVVLGNIPGGKGVSCDLQAWRHYVLKGCVCPRPLDRVTVDSLVYILLISLKRSKDLHDP